MIKGKLIVKCLECGNQHNFDPEDTEFELNSSEEKKMGPELTYAWEHTFNCNFGECENEIDINYEISQYPQNSNCCNDSILILGGEEIGHFSYDFSELEEN